MLILLISIQFVSFRLLGYWMPYAIYIHFRVPMVFAKYLWKNNNNLPFSARQFCFFGFQQYTLFFFSFSLSLSLFNALALFLSHFTICYDNSVIGKQPTVADVNIWQNKNIVFKGIELRLLRNTSVPYQIQWLLN